MPYIKSSRQSLLSDILVFKCLRFGQVYLCERLHVLWNLSASSECYTCNMLWSLCSTWSEAILIGGTQLLLLCRQDFVWLTGDYCGKSVPVVSCVGGCFQILLHTRSTLLAQLLKAGNAAHLFVNDKWTAIQPGLWFWTHSAPGFGKV